MDNMSHGVQNVKGCDEGSDPVLNYGQKHPTEHGHEDHSLSQHSMNLPTWVAVTHSAASGPLPDLPNNLHSPGVLVGAHGECLVGQDRLSGVPMPPLTCLHCLRDQGRDHKLNHSKH